MDVQQTNLLKSSSDAHTKLIGDLENPSVGSSFEEEKHSSNLHQRIFNSEQEALNSSGSLTMEDPQVTHRGRVESQLGELTSFERYYKTAMMMSIFISTGALVWTLFTLTLETNQNPWYYFDFPTRFCSVIQSVYAYQGFIKKDLKEMKTSLIFAKTTLLVMGCFLVAKLTLALKENEGKETSLDYGFFIYGVLVMGLYALLIYFPTRKVKNAFELIPQDDQRHMNDPLEELNSTIFILFKYGHLVAICLGVKWLICGIFEDLSPEEEILKIKMSEWGFFVSTIKGYFFIVFLLILISYFVLEGIRRKNLKKIETSTKLIKVFLIGYFLLNILEWVGLDNGRIVWRYEKSFFEFVMEQFTWGIGFFFIFYFGAFKAHGLLRVRERLRRPM